MAKIVSNFQELDQEWVDLIKEALDLGLTKEEIMNYLQQNKEKII